MPLTVSYHASYTMFYFFFSLMGLDLTIMTFPSYIYPYAQKEQPDSTFSKQVMFQNYAGKPDEWNFEK